MRKVAVVLSGCGVFDGSEIHEAVLTLYFLNKAEAEVKCFAPDKAQLHVIDHITQAPQNGPDRNVLIESARIARGEIKDLSNLNISEFDAVIFPGGLGAAKNLCTFGVDGTSCEIDPIVASVIQATLQAKKVLGAICIAPVLVAIALKDTDAHPKLTIGTDEGTKASLAELGAQPVDAQVNEIVVDETNKIVSTPAYMLANSISEAAEGIEKLVKEVLEMTQSHNWC